MEIYKSWWRLVVIFLQLGNIFTQGIDDIFRRAKRPPIDGSWSSWQSWSKCFKNSPNSDPFYPQLDNFVIQSRNRTCTSPRPLFGGMDCELPSKRIRQCSCANPLIGVTRLKDIRLTASSNKEGYSANESRFMDTSKGWCAKTKLGFFRETYMQIDFENFTEVVAIKTINNRQGRISRYKLKYSLDGKTWKYIEKSKNRFVFTGNLLNGKKKKNNFSTHLVMRYLKLIPTQSYGILPCLKMEVYGCVFTCGTMFTSPFGGIIARSSEYYDQNCLWMVEVLNTTSLTFTFDVFYVLCEYGYLDFRDSDFPFADAPLLNRICLTDADSEVPILKLNRNSVWINFVSNSSSNEIGFNINYLSKCHQTISLLKGKSVHIKSPNFPNNYFNNLNCLWTITPLYPSKKIEINVNKFSVESSSSSTKKCADDVVIIDVERDGNRVNYKSYCNINKPPSKIVVETEKLYILFKSDLITSDMGFSFSLVPGAEIIPPTTTNSIKPNSKAPGKDNNVQFVEKSGIAGSKQRHNITNGKPIRKAKDDTWTVIIICTFSSLVVVLIAAVIYMNLRRFIRNRNDVNAQCAKMAAQNKKKEKVNKGSVHERNLLVSPQLSLAKGIMDDAIEDETLLPDTSNIQESLKETEFIDTPIQVHNDIDIHNEMINSPDQVDGDIDDESSYQTFTPPSKVYEDITEIINNIDTPTTSKVDISETINYDIPTSSSRHVGDTAETVSDDEIPSLGSSKSIVINCELLDNAEESVL